MNLQTKYQGEVEINSHDIITFDNGIPGFLDERKFIILPLPDNKAISILQSVNTSELAFVIADPFIFFKDYEFSLDDQTIHQLEVKDETEIYVKVILTIQDPFNKSTANLQGPIIINTNINKAKQLILKNSVYKTKHPLFKENIESVKG